MNCGVSNPVIKMIKAQSGIEAIFAVSSLLVLFAFVMAFVYNQSLFNTELDESLSVLNSCWRFANTADSVFAASQGTEVNITFTNTNFTLFPASKFIRAESEAFEQVEFCTTRSSRFSNSLIPITNFTLKSGTIKFKKYSGIVVIKNA